MQSFFVLSFSSTNTMLNIIPTGQHLPQLGERDSEGVRRARGGLRRGLPRRRAAGRAGGAAPAAQAEAHPPAPAEPAPRD